MRVKYLAHSRCLVSGSQYYCSRRKLSILGNPKGVEVSGCGRVAYHRGGLMIERSARTGAPSALSSQG